MVSNENKIVKLPVLQYYDENIKKWVLKKITDENADLENIVIKKIEGQFATATAEDISSLFVD